MERTLIILKPDAVARGLMGQIITRFESKGLRLAGMKLKLIPRELAETHYGEHAERPFYASLLNFITSGPVLLLAVEGLNSVAICRKMIGATFGSKAEPGTIRGDFGVSNSFNLVHGSDSTEAAERELKLFFEESELVDTPKEQLAWVYDYSGGDPE